MSTSAAVRPLAGAHWSAIVTWYRISAFFNLNFIQSYKFHTIIEWQNHLGWKACLRSSVPALNITLPNPPLNHVSKHHIYVTFNIFRSGDSTTSLSSHFQCLTTLLGNTFFLISNLKHPCCNWRPFVLNFFPVPTPLKICCLMCRFSYTCL